MHTVKFALRTLARSPFVTTIAILSLALGIGANAAIFSLTNQILLRAVQGSEPGELVNLAAPGPKPGSTQCNQSGTCQEVFSYPMYRDLERAQHVLTGLAAHRSVPMNLAFRDQTLETDGILASGAYFPTLGLVPAAGRLLTPADDDAIGAHPVAVLSYDLWQTRLGSDRSILGQSILVNGRAFTVIGVAPEGFNGTTVGTHASIFIPLTMRGAITRNFTGFEERRRYWLYVFGRLKPGVTMQQAAVALNAIYRPILSDVEAPLQEKMSEQTMAKFKAKQIVLDDGRRGQSQMHNEAKTPLILLFATTGIVLLIACANIANLLLARAANRSMEMAVRLSLGAGRAQLMRQLLTEAVLLALGGGVVSIVVAKWTLAGLAALLPPEALTSLQLTLDPAVVLFATVLALATGFLFGLFPAIHSTRPDLVGTIRANAGNLSSAKSATRFRNSLVTGQIALSMTLLICAGLFIRSLLNVSRVQLGLESDHVVTFSLSPSLSGMDYVRSRAFFARVEDALRATPGVRGVVGARVPILAGDNWGNSVRVEGFKAGPDTDVDASFNGVGPGFLATLGIPLLQGREFTTADIEGAPQVAVINEAFAKKFGLGHDPVGKHIGLGQGEATDIEIVGLAKDAKYNEVKGAIPPQFFLPYRQDSTVGSLYFYVRTAIEPQALLRSIPPLVSTIDPNIPVTDLKTLPQQVRENVFLDRMISTMSSAFAVLATLLAGVGLYGVLAYTVAQRTREFGVRMALGADGPRVRGMVLRQVGRLTVIGGIIGVAAAYALGKSAQSLLFGLASFDPLSVSLAAALLALVALGAGYIPAVRASRVHPMRALRYE